MSIGKQLGVAIVVFAIGCASGSEELESPDIEGTWTAPALQNVDPSRPGKDEVPEGVILFFEEGEIDDPDADPVFQTIVGDASITLAMFYQVGNEPDGFTAILKMGGTAKFSGTWEADGYDEEEEEHFIEFSLPCEAVTKTDEQAPALVCGANGVSSRLDGNCTREDGNPTLSCYISDAGGNFTFQRKR